MSSQPEDILEITSDDAVLDLAPRAGGRLMTWRVGGEPVIFWPAAPDWSNFVKIRGGNPLLFPFLGRHFVDVRSASGAIRKASCMNSPCTVSREIYRSSTARTRTGTACV